MAKSSDGENRPPPDLLLTDISDEGTEPKTKSATSPGELPENELGPDAPSRQGDEPSSGVERSARAGADAEKEARELRSGVDTKVQGTKQSLDDLSERLEKIEAAVGELPALQEVVGRIVEQLKLARSALVGQLDKMEKLEQKLSEIPESVERGADAARETADGLRATGKKVADSADIFNRLIRGFENIERDVNTLKGIAWGAVIAFLMLAGVVLLALERFGLFGR